MSIRDIHVTCDTNFRTSYLRTWGLKGICSYKCISSYRRAYTCRYIYAHTRIRTRKYTSYSYTCTSYSHTNTNISHTLTHTSHPHTHTKAYRLLLHTHLILTHTQTYTDTDTRARTDGHTHGQTYFGLPPARSAEPCSSHSCS